VTVIAEEASMIAKTPCCTFITLTVLVSGALTFAQTTTPVAKPPVEDGEPGFVTINPEPNCSWVQDATDQLALRYTKVVLRESFQEVPTARIKEVAARPMQLPDTVEAISTIAGLSKHRVVQLSPDFLWVASAKSDIQPHRLLVTAEHVAGLGIAVDPDLDTHTLELLLMQLAGDRWSEESSQFGAQWNSIYYWASQEGRGREFFVQGQRTSSLSPYHPPMRDIGKVRVEGSGTRLKAEIAWKTAEGKPLGSGSSGPVAALEIDFDLDNVIDIVAFAGGSRGTTQYAKSPLVVISGRTGEVMGTVGTEDDYEYLVFEAADGRRHVVTQGRTGFGRYVVNDDAKVELEGREELGDEAMLQGRSALLRGARSPSTGKEALQLAPREKVLAHFLAELRISRFDGPGFRGLATPPVVGLQLRMPPGGAKDLPNAHVLLDYWPKPAAEQKPQR
jgi:hypothetical protein